MESRLEREIDVKKLFSLLKKRFWVIVVITMLFTSIGGFYVTLPRTPLYESSTRIYLQANSELFKTIQVILREPAVLEGVREELGLHRSAEALRGQISVGSVEGSTILRISVIDSDPLLAANIANTIVSSYQKMAKNTAFEANLLVLTMAEAGKHPINPKSNRALYIGIVMGILFGVSIVFVMDSLDDTIRSEREIEQLLGVTVLGNVSKIKKRDIMSSVNKPKAVSLRGETTIVP